MVTEPTPQEQAYAAAVLLRSQQIDEYSMFIAAQPIDIGGARAFNVGDPVPKGHIEKFPDWVRDGLVVTRENVPEDVTPGAVPLVPLLLPDTPEPPTPEQPTTPPAKGST